MEIVSSAPVKAAVEEKSTTVNTNDRKKDPLSPDRARFKAFRKLFRFVQKKVVDYLVDGYFEFIGDSVTPLPSLYTDYIEETKDNDLFSFSEKMSLFISIVSWRSKLPAEEKFRKFFYAIKDKMIQMGRVRQADLRRLAINCKNEEERKNNKSLSDFLYVLYYCNNSGEDAIRSFAEGVMDELLKLHEEYNKKTIGAIKKKDIKRAVYYCTQSGIFNEIAGVNAIDSSLRLSDLVEDLDDDIGNLSLFIYSITSGNIIEKPFVLAHLIRYIEGYADISKAEADANGLKEPVDCVPITDTLYDSDTDDEEEILPDDEDDQQMIEADPLKIAQREADHYKNLYKEAIEQNHMLRAELSWICTQRSECLTPTMVEAEVPSF